MSCAFRSHSVLKTLVPPYFRSQEDHGALEGAPRKRRRKLKYKTLGAGWGEQLEHTEPAMEPEVEGATETPLQGATRAMDRQVPRETSLTQLPITGYLAPPARMTGPQWRIGWTVP